ncbi:MAG: hypothetical protein EXS69_01470 [Candidatus Zambryskibacteria bacterium]|nr:hypothetical protein [Candidatus Zambryskibacteria bacterium]
MFEKSNKADLSTTNLVMTEEVSFDEEGHIERFPWLKKLFLSLVIILVAGLSFGIGRLTGVGKSEPIQIEYNQEISNFQSPISNQASVYASSKGERYYYANCSGLSRVSEANKVNFATAAIAEARGYTLASNCSPIVNH